MKSYEILKTFKGSQHGNDVAVFEKGTTHKLSPSLAKVCLENDMVKEAPAEETSGDARKRSVKVEAVVEKKDEPVKVASTATMAAKTPPLGNKLLALAKGK